MWGSASCSQRPRESRQGGSREPSTGVVCCDCHRRGPGPGQVRNTGLPFIRLLMRLSHSLCLPETHTFINNHMHRHAYAHTCKHSCTNIEHTHARTHVRTWHTHMHHHAKPMLLSKPVWWHKMPPCHSFRSCTCTTHQHT